MAEETGSDGSPKNIGTKGGGGNPTIGARQSRFSICAGSADVAFIIERFRGVS
jgi:hypothetical protein